MPRESLHSPRRVEAKKRATQAMELRLAGATYDEIAEALGWKDKSSAYRAVARGIDRMMEEPTERVRKMQNRRYERLLRAVWPSAVKGDYQAVQRAESLLDKLSRLNGFDLSEKVRVSGKLDVEHRGTVTHEVRVTLTSEDRQRALFDLARNYPTVVLDRTLEAPQIQGNGNGEAHSA
jgi:hypothetical protein